MKNTISILLVMALVLAMMTACVKSDAQATASGTQATSEVQSTTSEVKIIGTVDEQLPAVPRHECKVKSLDKDEILEMTDEEISDYFAEMVHISQAEDLCSTCMDRIGWNFFAIDRFSTSSFDKAEYEEKASLAFDNILAKAEKLQIPFDSFNLWELVPVANVLCKYCSGTNFISPLSVCPQIDELQNEEEIVEVAKVFFANPIFASNYSFAFHVIKECSSEELIDMSWNHLMALSKSSDTNLSDYWTTYLACSCMMAPSSVQSDETNVLQIAENILENYHYNFVAKYLFICSDFDSESDLNTEIRDMAFEHLLDITQNADEETYDQVVETAVKLYDKYNLATDEVEALYGNYDIGALVSYLQSWKEISKTEMPRYY